MTKLKLHLPVFGSRKGPAHYTSYRIPFETAKLVSRVARTASLDLTKKEEGGPFDDWISQTEATVQIVEQAVKLFAMSNGVQVDPALKPSKHARAALPAKKSTKKAPAKTAGAKTPVKKKPATKPVGAKKDPSAKKAIAKKAPPGDEPKPVESNDQTTAKTEAPAKATKKASAPKAKAKPKAKPEVAAEPAATTTVAPTVAEEPQGDAGDLAKLD